MKAELQELKGLDWNVPEWKLNLAFCKITKKSMQKSDDNKVLSRECSLQ